MQELRFEQVEEVSGGFNQGPFIVDNHFNSQSQNVSDEAREVAEAMCYVIDSALGGIAGRAVSGALKLNNTAGTAAGTSVAAGLLTPCGTFAVDSLAKDNQRYATTCTERYEENQAFCNR